jgi:hypothetical protein
MKSLFRRVLGLGMATLLLMSLAGTGLAFPSEGRRGAEDRSLAKVPGLVFCQIADIGHHGDGPPVLISIVSSERGFALGPENETLPIMLQVEKVREIDPSWVRRLLGENRTLGEIKAQIEGDDGAYSYRGNMRLGHAHYLLENLNVTSEDLNSTLEADLMEPVWGAIPAASEPGHEIAGHVSIETRHQEDGSAIGVGSLVIFSGPYAGSYLILLDSSIGTGCGMESCPAWAGDLAGLDAREMSPQGVGPSFSTWRGPGFQDPFLETILRSSGMVTISSSFRPGCRMGGCPFEPDQHDMMPWDLGCGEPWPEGFGWPGGHFDGDPTGFATGDGPYMLHHGF